MVGVLVYHLFVELYCIVLYCIVPVLIFKGQRCEQECSEVYEAITDIVFCGINFVLLPHFHHRPWISFNSVLHSSLSDYKYIKIEMNVKVIPLPEAFKY